MLKRGGYQRKIVVHYDLHGELDIKHADDFFSIVKTQYGVDEDSKDIIDQGLRMCAVLFNNLYDNYFTIYHGKNYFKFFDLLGKPFFVAKKGNKVIGVYAAVLRHISLESQKQV